MIVADIITEAQTVYLHDPIGAIYTSAKMLPIVRKVNGDLELELINNGALESKEVSADITVPLGTTVLNGVVGFPSDFLEPIALGQRDVGSTGPYTPIGKLREDPFVQNPNNEIQGWFWRENEIKIGPSSAAKLVRLVYKKGLTTIVDVNSNIVLTRSRRFLAAQSAAVACALIGENPSRAALIQPEAEIAKQQLLGMLIKKKQSTPVRRKRYHPFGRI